LTRQWRRVSRPECQFSRVHDCGATSSIAFAVAA
jgi:hypothetical protein